MTARESAAPPSFEELELLLESASRGLTTARPALELALLDFAAGPAPAPLAVAARGARLLWGAAALPGGERFRPAASLASTRLTEVFLDVERRAFRAEPNSRVLPAAGNALAALALARAAAAGQPGAVEGAALAVDFLRARLYDPLLGLMSAEGAQDFEYGLLGDVAWSALAAEELGRLFGGEGRKEFADELASVLVKELWNPARGGFYARIPRADSATAAAPLPDPGDEAAALEACWRLGRALAFRLGLAAARKSAGGDVRALAAVARASSLSSGEAEAVK